MATTKTAKFVIPKEQGKWPDLLNDLKTQRLELQRQADAIEAQEKELKQKIIDTLPKSSATGIIGKAYQVKVIEKDIPQVDTENDGWAKVQAYVKKTGNFDLLQRRLNDGLIRELWEAGKQVPGVKLFKAKTVSLTKV